MRFIIALALVALVGCVSSPTSITLSAFPDVDHVDGVSMLADANNPAEMKAAPVIVRLAIHLNKTKQLLKRQRISVDTAITARDCADRIKQDIDTAVIRKDLKAIDVAAQKIPVCESIIEVAK